MTVALSNQNIVVTDNNYHVLIELLRFFDQPTFYSSVLKSGPEDLLWTFISHFSPGKSIKRWSGRVGPEESGLEDFLWTFISHFSPGKSVKGLFRKKNKNENP